MSGSERGQQSFLEWLATLLCLRPARENNQGTFETMELACVTTNLPSFQLQTPLLCQALL